MEDGDRVGRTAGAAAPGPMPVAWRGTCGGAFSEHGNGLRQQLKSGVLFPLLSVKMPFDVLLAVRPGMRRRARGASIRNLVSEGLLGGADPG